MPGGCSRGLLGRAALLLGSVVAALLVGELALRHFVDESRWSRRFPGTPWPWLVTDPVLGWKNQPGFSNLAFRINARGFRGGEIQTEKAPGSIRIACLGDSVTFGLWRNGRNSLGFDGYVEILRSRLAESGRGDVEVLNAGVLGYSSSNGLLQLVTRIVPLDPDVVVARFGFNEHSLAYDPSYRVGEPGSRLGRELLYRFADWKLLRLSLLALRRLPSRAEPFRLHWVEPDRFAHDLRRLAELAEANDFELLLMDYPLRRAERGDSPGAPVGLAPEFGARSVESLHEIHASYQDVLVRTAEQEGIPLLRTAPACALPGDPCFGDYDLAHPNRFGAELHARRVHEELLERGWLEPRAEPRPDAP